MLPVTDLRLVPAALAAWLGAALLVAAPVSLAGGVAALTAAVAGGGAILLVRRSERAPRVGPAGHVILVAAAVSAVALSVAGQVALRESGPLDALVAEGAVVVLEGQIRSEPAPVASGFGEGFRVVVAARAVSGRGETGGAAARVLVLGGTAWSGVSYGDRVRLTGRLVPAEAGRDTVAVVRALEPPVVVTPASGVDRTVNALRSGLLTTTAHLGPDARGLVPGLALGDTSRLDPGLDQAMRDVSLTHVTAVSGAHFAIIGAAVLGLVTLLGVPRWGRAVAVLVTTVGFVLLVHPEPSVLRAAVMGSIGVLALLLGRPSRAMPALATAVLGLLVVDPWLARSYGFVLSALATAGLVLVARPIAVRLERWLPSWLAHAIAVPFAAQLACAPVLVLLAPSIATYAVPANLLAAPALIPGTVLGVLATLVAPWWPWLAVQLAMIAGWACSWLAVVARAGAGLPGALLPWPGGPGGAIALAAVLLGACVLVVRRHSLPRGVWFAAGAVAVCCALLLTPPGRRATLAVAPDGRPPPGWQVVLCDVGQGTSLVVRSGEQSAVVVDVGPAEGNAGACLDRLGVRRVELLVLSHFHADHVDGLAEVLSGREVTAALVSPVEEPEPQAAAARAALERRGIGTHTARTGMSGQAGEVTWHVLWPGDLTSGTGANDASVVMWLATPQSTVLALGDLETLAQDQLARALRSNGARSPAEIVVMAHHGSARQSEALAELLDPAVVLVGVGADNTYGHPAQSALDLYAGARILRTDLCGHVVITATHHSSCRDPEPPRR